MDTYPFTAGVADATVDTVYGGARMLPLVWRKGNPSPKAASRSSGGRQTTVERAACARLFDARGLSVVIVQQNATVALRVTHGDPRDVAGNPYSPQAVVFLTSIIDVIVGY